MSGGAETAHERTLGELGERRILAELLAPRYRDVEGFGDDSAVLGAPLASRAGGELVATTDSCPTPLLASVGRKDPFYTGWLLATINLSDLAAAGAVPLGLVANYTLPRRTTVREFERLLDGVDACAAAHGTRVVGGDLRDGEQRQLSATAVGQCAPGRRLGRFGALAGDRMLLVGSPGYLWSAVLLAGGQAVLPEPDAKEVWSRACHPVAQLTAGRVLAESGLGRAAMDVSDGLYATVRSLCAANELGAVLDTDVRLDPVVARVCELAGLGQFELAQTWGDWCLVVAVRPGDVSEARRRLTAASVPVRDIGSFTDGHETTDLGTTGTGRTGISLDVQGRLVPWRGVAQERFSATSWHGGELHTLVQQLRGPTD